MAEDNPDAPWSLGNLEQALRTIQEKSDDIEWAEILLSQAVLTYGGYPAAPLSSGTMILHLLNAQYCPAAGYDRSRLERRHPEPNGHQDRFEGPTPGVEEETTWLR